MDVSKWRVAQVNMEERPFAIIRSDGRFGDEFVAHSLSESTARLLCGVGGIRWDGPNLCPDAPREIG